MSACENLVVNYLDYSEYELGHRQKTVTTNRYLLYRFLNFLPDGFDLRKISEKIFLDYICHLQERNCAETTIRHNRTVVMGFLKYLHRTGDIDEIFEPETRRFSRKLYRVLSGKELFKLCNAADDTSTFLGIRDRTILEIAFSSGLRIGEIISLRANDMNLEQGHFKIYGKGGKERYGLLCDRALYWVKRYLALRAEQNTELKHLFFSAKNKPLDHSALVRILNKTVKKSKLTGHITFHTIRRSFATNLSKNGMGIRHLQELMGHSSIESTQLYLVYDTTHLKKALELHPLNKLRQERAKEEVTENQPAVPQEVTVEKKEKNYQVKIEASFYEENLSKITNNDLFNKFAPIFYKTYGDQLVNNMNGNTTSQVIKKNLKNSGLTDEEIDQSIEMFLKCRLMYPLRSVVLRSGKPCVYYRFNLPHNVKITETVTYKKVTEVPKKNMMRVRKGYQIKFSDELIGKIDPCNFKMPDVLLALNKIYYYYGNMLLTKYECRTYTTKLHELLAEFNYTEKQSEDFIQVLLKSGILEFLHFGSDPLNKYYKLRKIKGIIIRRDKRKMSDNNRYYWLKLKNDFFNQKEIKKLRKIAGGDTYTIIYLKMLLMSISDNGVIYYDGHEDNLVEQISLTIDEDFDNVKITMLFLEKHDLIETYGTDIKLPEAVSSIGTETRSAERVRKHREAKALQCNSAVTEEKQPVTICNTEIDIELEKEINTNAQMPARECEEQLSKSDLLKNEANEIFDYYLEIFKDLRKSPRRSPDKINKIVSRLKEFSTAELKQAINICRANPYLCGDNPRENFYATVEYVFRSFAQTERILERASTAPPLQLPDQDLTQLSHEEFINLIKTHFTAYDIGEAIKSLQETKQEVSRKAIFQWHIDKLGKVKNARK